MSNVTTKLGILAYLVLAPIVKIYRSTAFHPTVRWCFWFFFFLISLTVLFCYGILNSPYEMFSKDNKKSKQKRKEPKTLEHFDDGKKWIKADLCIVDFLIRLLSSYVHLIAYEIYNTIRFCLIFVCSYINTQ